jgi:hypothetical protein
MPCAVEANGTEMVLPFSSASDCTFESFGTTMPLPLPKVLPDSTVMKMLFLPRLLEGGAVEGAGEVGHGAEVELAGDHLVGQRRAGGEVLPLDVVLRRPCTCRRGRYFSSSLSSRISRPPVAQLMVVSCVPMAMRMVSACVREGQRSRGLRPRRDRDSDGSSS